MAQVHPQPVVSDDYRGPDRRRPGLLGKVERLTIRMIRSKWVAAFVTAVAVSWCFHIVEEKNDEKLAAQQRVTVCVIEHMAVLQELEQPVHVSRILQACEKQRGK